MDRMIQRQLDLEQRMIDSGRRRFEEQLKKAIAQGRLSETSTGLAIILNARDALAKALDAAQTRTGRTGPMARADKFIAGIPSEETAHLVLSIVLNKAQNITLQTVVDHVADGVESYVRSLSWDGPVDAPLPEKESKQLGISLFERIRAVAPELVHEQSRARKASLLTLSSEVEQTIAKAPELKARPIYLPCVVPPLDWTDLTERGTGGGYHSPALRRRLAVMKNRPWPYLTDLSHVDLSVVLSALNAVQATPWRINRPVYDVMLALEPGGPDTAGCMSPDARLRLDVATEFRDDVFYFPHVMDWRGRIYAVPAGLNPQMGDAEKGLLTFAEGKPISTTEAANRLAIHGATVYGRTKDTLQGRVQWVNDNEPMILASAADPLGTHEWREADGGDGRWQFLAFCFEWAVFKREGLGFVSSLPVGMDATCSVLQHFAAMMRDEPAGRAVNLVPAKRPQDAYQDVAEAVKARLVADGGEMAQFWLGQINRKLVKPAVMTFPYGAERGTRRQQIKDTMIARGAPATYPQLDYLTDHVDAVLLTSQPAAMRAMEWLKVVTRLVAKEKKTPILWNTPTGLPVLLMEPKRKKKLIPVVIRGKSYRHWYYLHIPGSLDTAAQVRGISPSFVHSLDAAHLMLTVNAARARGIRNFAMVHDCYGTTAADAAVMAEVLRETFSDMYEQHEPLTELRDGLLAVWPDVIFPEPPKTGNLDVSAVRRSLYFFS